MRQSPRFPRKITTSLPPKPTLKPGHFKFVLNGKFEVTLRIAQPLKFTYQSLLAILAAQQIIEIVDDIPFIQQQALAIKNQHEVELSSDLSNMEAFSMNFHTPQATNNSTQQGDQKRKAQLRPASVRRKLFSSAQLDLLQKFKQRSTSKPNSQPEITSEKPATQSAKFRLRKTSISFRQQANMTSSDKIKDSFVTTNSNQFDSSESCQSPTLSHQKPFRRKVSRIKLKIKKFHEQDLL